MNYFEFYEIPETLIVDSVLAKKKFLELSRKYHPDFYGNKSEDAQNAALEFSTLNTNAFNTFKNNEKTLEYVLKLHQMLDDSESNALPQEFLMEMMDINEQLMELEFEPNEALLHTIQTSVLDFQHQLDSEFNTIAHNYLSLNNNEKKSVLISVKEYYLKNKYLSRIQKTLEKMS